MRTKAEVQWTRAHDAWIAEKCEGRKILGPGVMYHDERGGEAGWHEEMPIPHYLTDPASAIRAAEAWRKKGKFRIVRLSMHSRGCSARLYNGLNWINSGPYTDPAAALAQALYRATGGPA